MWLLKAYLIITRALSNLHFAWDKLQIQTHPNFPHEEICKLEKKFPVVKKALQQQQERERTAAKLYCCGAARECVLLIYASWRPNFHTHRADAEKKAPSFVCYFLKGA